VSVCRQIGARLRPSAPATASEPFTGTQLSASATDICPGGIGSRVDAWSDSGLLKCNYESSYSSFQKEKSSYSGELQSFVGSESAFCKYLQIKYTWLTNRKAAE